MSVPVRCALPLALDPAAWAIVNDDVMGGVSRSRLDAVTGGLRFSGALSLEFNGGFASARTAFDGRAWLAATRRDRRNLGHPERSEGPRSGPNDFHPTSLALRVRGDGRIYKLTAFVRGADGGRAPHQFQAEFATDGDLQQVTLALAAFRASFRGRAVAAPPLAVEDIVAVGLQISDRIAGPFALELQEAAVNGVTLPPPPH